MNKQSFARQKDIDSTQLKPSLNHTCCVFMETYKAGYVEILIMFNYVLICFDM